MKKIAASFAIVLLALGSGAVALDYEPFTQERFEQLQQQDSLILVDIFADWCPTCSRQHELLGEYQQSRDGELHVLQVDFDQQKEWVRHFQAPRQSTLILYHGEDKLWFSVAETDRERLFHKLDEGMERQ